MNRKICVDCITLVWCEILAHTYDNHKALRLSDTPFTWYALGML